MNRYKEAILYIVFILVVLILTVVKTYPKIVDTITVYKNINSQTIQQQDLQTKLDALKKAEMEKMTVSGISKKIFKSEIPGADTETSFSTVFDDVINMAKYNGLKIYAIQYTYNPPDDEFVKGATGKYNVCQLDMEVIVDYQDLESFLKDIYKYPYLINIDMIELTPYPKNKKILLTNLQIKLYSQI